MSFSSIQFIRFSRNEGVKKKKYFWVILKIFF